MNNRLEDNEADGGILTCKRWVIKTCCRIIGALCEKCSTRFLVPIKCVFGILISNYQLIKGTFMDGDSDTVGIMMHASGMYACILSDSYDCAFLYNLVIILCPSKLVDKESIYENT